MINFLYYELLLNIHIIFIFSFLSTKLFNIHISKAFLISISLITIFCTIFFKIGFYKYSILLLNFFSFAILFFSSVREVIYKNKLIIFEIFVVLIILFFFSKNRILMDEDELYFWAVKYKYFIESFLLSGSLNFNEIEEPFKNSNYGNSAAIFQTFITSFIGFNEGGAIFANNIIIVSSFYFLFGEKIKKFHYRLIYFLLLYLLLNNLSFGFLSIYNDPTVSVIFGVLVYYLYQYFDYKEYKKIFIFLLLLIFFLNLHRITIALTSFLIILYFFKFFNYKKKFIYFFSSILISLLVIVVYSNLNSVYLFSLEDIKKNFILKSEKSFFKEIIFYLKTIFVSYSYNSQFGVVFNEVASLLKIDFVKMPEYIWHNFLWFLLISVLMFVNKDEIKKLNNFFITILIIFSILIIFNKVYQNYSSTQVFGRYISFIFIPCILINLVYLNHQKIHYKKILISLFIILLTSTPKKSFGFFVSQSFYAKYNDWNNFYFDSRKKNKSLFRKISNSFNNDNKIVAVFGNKTKETKHPSIFKSALKLDLYPYNVVTINLHDLILNDFPLNHYLGGRKIIIYYGLNIKEINIVKSKIEKFKINNEFILF